MLSGDDKARFAPAIRAEQIRTLFRHHPLSLIGTAVVGVMAYFVLRHEVNYTHLWIWSLAVIIVVVARGTLWLLFRMRERDDDVIFRWGVAAVSFSFASGVVWAALPAMFIRGDAPFTMINVVIMCVGMLAGSLISHSVYLPSYLAFSLPLAISLSGSVHIFGGPYQHLAYLGYVFSLVIVGFARNTGRVFRRDELMKLHVSFDEPEERRYKVEVDPDADPVCVERRSNWLASRLAG